MANRIITKEVFCPDCKKVQGFTLSRQCGVFLCDECDHHLTLARCFCGWNLQPGERLEDDTDADDGPMEFSESPEGYEARERWARRYDELNGAPESEEDR